MSVLATNFKHDSASTAPFMPITLSSAVWPLDASPPQEQLRPVGRNALLVDGTGVTPALQWVMKRNCSLTPAQMMAVYVGLCVISFCIAMGFFAQGASLILAFAGLEMLLVGAALLAYARHAADRETITLAGQRVNVECVDGRVMARADFHADWLAVEPVAGQGSLIELSGQGQRIRVGRFVRPELRATLAQDIRGALRRARLFAAPLHPGTEPK